MDAPRLPHIAAPFRRVARLLAALVLAAALAVPAPVWALDPTFGDGAIEFADPINGNTLVIDASTLSFLLTIEATGDAYAGLDPRMTVTRHKLIVRYRSEDLSYFVSINVDLVRNSARATVLDRSGTRPVFRRLYHPPVAQGESINRIPTVGPRTRLVVIDNYAFSPKRLVVPINTQIIWFNRATATHTVTAANGSFDSGPMVTGDRFDFKANRYTGYTYVCTVHNRNGSSFMRGQVVVQ